MESMFTAGTKVEFYLFANVLYRDLVEVHADQEKTRHKIEYRPYIAVLWSAITNR